MTEDQQKQPESESSPPQTPPTPATERLVEAKLRKQRLQARIAATENRKQPFIKAQTIKTLRGTIGLLESVVEKLETEPIREIPPTVASPATTTVSAPVSDTTTATPELEWESTVSELAVSDTPTETPEAIVSDIPTVTSEPVVSDTPTKTLEPIVSDIPTVTPEPVVSDIPTVTPEVVTAESAREPVPQPAKPGLVDRILPSFDKLQAFWDATLARVRLFLPSAWSNNLSDWALTGAIAGIVVVVLVTTAALLPDTPAQVAKAPPETIETPPELTAPQPPQPVEVAPSPQPELTPEQSLVASIQQQVAELSDRYGKGLIQSIEANFLASRLIVKVSDGWYTLEESQQDKLADDILRRSREMDFSKLEITDLEGTLLARNPVVGTNMVILKRQELAANL
jgi:hypothetical protein